jgi:hypothetical protein
MTGLLGTFDRDLFMSWARERINDGKRHLVEISLREKSQSEIIKMIPIEQEQRTPNGLRCVASEIEREAAFFAQQVGGKVAFLACAHYQGMKRPLGSFPFVLETIVKDKDEEEDETDRKSVMSLMAKIIKDQHVLTLGLAANTNRQSEIALEEMRRGFGEMKDTFASVVSELRIFATDMATDARKAHGKQLEMRVELEETLSAQAERDDKKRRRETAEKILQSGYQDIKKHGPALLAAFSGGKVPIAEFKKHPAFTAIKSIVDSIEPQQLPMIMQVLKPEARASFGALVKFFEEAEAAEKAERQKSNGSAPS